jgi:hypothetical protein
MRPPLENLPFTVISQLASEWFQLDAVKIEEINLGDP